LSVSIVFLDLLVRWLNSLYRAPTCRKVPSEGVKAVVLAVFSGFSLLRAEELKPVAMVFIGKIERH
jgi:hypothetical protein